MTDKIVKEINNYNFWIFLHTHTEKSKIKLLKAKFIQIEKKTTNKKWRTDNSNKITPRYT